MNYFTREIQTEEGVRHTAGIKARDDIDEILTKSEYEGITIDVPSRDRKQVNIIKKMLYHISLKKAWEKKVNKVGSGDNLIIQFPIINHSVLIFNVIQNAQKRGAKVVLLIHDLEMLRVAMRKDTPIKKKIRLNFEEKSLLKTCDYMIVHNEKMKSKLSSMGFPEEKMIVLEIFDYLLSDKENLEVTSTNTRAITKPIVIAGALRKHKAKYVYNLPDNCYFNLYGVGYEGISNNFIRYYGSFEPEKLVTVMDGSFGLVWDGESCKTCEGVYGEYLRINNPHKTSLYLAAGMPVIIWREAALADFVLKHNCGLVVDSLNDLNSIFLRITEEEYNEMKKNACMLAGKLRKGYFTQTVLSDLQCECGK